jgi:hypothetical protein
MLGELAERERNMGAVLPLPLLDCEACWCGGGGAGGSGCDGGSGGSWCRLRKG